MNFNNNDTALQTHNFIRQLFICNHFYWNLFLLTNSINRWYFVNWRVQISSPVVYPELLSIN